MAAHKIPLMNWATVLADKIRTAEDGDTILVHNEVMRELAERARGRMCPEKKLEFAIERPNS